MHQESYILRNDRLEHLSSGWNGEPRDLRNEPMVNAPVLPQLRDREMKEGESLTKVSTSVFPAAGIR